jgi:hypothetical protein
MTQKQADLATVHTMRNNASNQGGQTLLRWALQAEARAIMPDERIADCLRVPHSATVDVMFDPEHRKGHYAGLCTCGSVWMCPLCAAKISERRRDECTRGIDEMNRLGLAIFMATYTIKHDRYDDLAKLLAPFLDAHHGMWRNTAGRKIKKDCGIFGTIRALEVTWGWGTSWHPHIHEIICVNRAPGDADLGGLGDRLFRAWQTETKRVGLVVNRKGFDFAPTRGAVEDYVAKFGREPIKTPWGVEQEVSKAHVKQSRVAGRFTPFGLLLGVYQGHDELAPKFREFATYFKGKRQVHWSKGLKQLLLEEEEKSDQELAAELREEAVLLGRLTRDQWHAVLGNDIRGELLQVANSGDWDQVREFLAGFGIEV